MTYQQALRKRKIETALAAPMVLLGKLLSRFFRPKGKPRLFIFAPSADIGGANVINADIVRSFPDLEQVVIFSKLPKDNQLLHLFEQPGVTLWDLHKKIDFKSYHFVNVFYRGVIAQWVNKTPKAVVIGGESLYFHKVFPWLNKDVKTIELSHLGTWFNYTQQFVHDIGTRVFSTKKLMRDAITFYDQQKIPASLKSRMSFIDTMVAERENIIQPDNKQLEVIFIGRGSPQKRVYLVAEIAKKAHEKKLPIHFSFAGEVSNIIDTSFLPYCTFYGNIKNRARLEEIQQESDVLLLTSAFEGLPVVVIEMMSFGKVIVSTAVNAIPDYIKDGVNGFLIPDNKDESKIVEDALIALSILASDRSLLLDMGKQNLKETKEKFSKELFYTKWKELIENN